MSFEIEKKFLVHDFDKTIEHFKELFGKYTLEVKSGFWWTGNYSGVEGILDVTSPVIFSKHLKTIRDIAELPPIEEMDFQFLRMRIKNKKRYLLTFKKKSVVDSIEENIEYEYEVDKDVFKRLLEFLIDEFFVFYYNIKKTWVFTDKTEGAKIELSTFNDLKHPYVEVEVTGKHKIMLTKKLKRVLDKITKTGFEEETRSYALLSSIENKEELKKKKLSQYSKEAVNELLEVLS